MICEMSDEVAAAQKRLDEVTKRFESQFTVYPEIGNHALSVTGEEYAVILSDGVVDRVMTFASDGRRRVYDTAEEAIASLDDVLNHYAAGTRALYGGAAVLYWRMKPEIDKCLDSAIPAQVGKWKTYSRLLISGKPARYPARLTQREQEYRFPVVPPTSEESPCPIPTTSTASTT